MYMACQSLWPPGLCSLAIFVVNCSRLESKRWDQIERQTWRITSTQALDLDGEPDWRYRISDRESTGRSDVWCVVENESRKGRMFVDWWRSDWQALDSSRDNLWRSTWCLFFLKAKESLEKQKCASSFLDSMMIIEVDRKKSFTINKINIENMYERISFLNWVYRGTVAIGEEGDGMTFDVVISSGSWLVIQVRPAKTTDGFLCLLHPTAHYLPHFKFVSMYFSAFVHCSGELALDLVKRRKG